VLHGFNLPQVLKDPKSLVSYLMSLPLTVNSTPSLKICTLKNNGVMELLQPPGKKLIVPLVLLLNKTIPLLSTVNPLKVGSLHPLALQS